MFVAIKKISLAYESFFGSYIYAVFSQERFTKVSVYNCGSG